MRWGACSLGLVRHVQPCPPTPLRHATHRRIRWRHNFRWVTMRLKMDCPSLLAVNSEARLRVVPPDPPTRAQKNRRPRPLKRLPPEQKIAFSYALSFVWVGSRGELDRTQRMVGKDSP